MVFRTVHFPKLNLSSGTIALPLFPVGFGSTVHGLGEGKYPVWESLSFKNAKIGNWLVLLICFPPCYMQ